MDWNGAWCDYQVERFWVITKAVNMSVCVAIIHNQNGYKRYDVLIYKYNDGYYVVDACYADYGTFQSFADALSFASSRAR